jgi:hypothetical protein
MERKPGKVAFKGRILPDAIADRVSARCFLGVHREEKIPPRNP